MKPIDAREMAGRSRSFKAIFLLAIGACAFTSSCKSSETIWSAEAKSPDGKVVASVRAVLRNKGLSIISGVDTYVYLNWAGDRRPSMLILSLADGSDNPVDTNVEMKWLTPTHLELTYNGNQTVDFEAIKWAAVDISVRNPVNEKTRGGTSGLRNDAPDLHPREI
jgi:hypothetical protein